MIVIGLGGNTGGDEAVRERFVHAREALSALGPVRSASLYRSAPIGPEQPPFLNSAVGITAVDVVPDELIATVLEIEHLLGRDRRGATRWGPRPIDLDVLAWDQRVITSTTLEVPHPRAFERRFALLPLIDLLGASTTLPGLTASLGSLAERTLDQVVELVTERW